MIAGVITVWCNPEDFELVHDGGRFDLHVTFADPETKEIIKRERLLSPGVNG